MILESKVIAALAGHALKKPLEELYATSKEKISELLAKISTPEYIANSKEKIEAAQLIRTISCREPISLLEIYYPAKIIIASSKAIEIDCIESLTSIQKNKKFVFTGIAGQGKSVLLRYLWIKSIESGNCIPIFVNLRDANHGANLDELIASSLFSIGIPAEQKSKEYLEIIKNKNTRIFLDGLDEVNREYLISLKSEILELEKNNKDITIIITSRPGSIADHLYDMPGYKFYKLAKLTDADYRPFLDKIGVPSDAAQKLVESLSAKENHKVKQIIETPLMLTLLNIVYGHKTVIPKNLPDIYTEMFNALAQTHDETKTGYIRQWATNLTTSELRKIFEAFCYTSLEIASNSMSIDAFNEAHEAALNITNLSCTAPGFRTDMIESVCLMAKDGIHITFCHKSIQEFFCALFIANSKDEEFIKEFYKSISNPSRILKFYAVLDYLEQLDPIRYIENSLEPEWNEFCANHGITKGKNITIKNISSITNWINKSLSTGTPFNSRLSMLVFGLIAAASLNDNIENKNHTAVVRSNPSARRTFKQAFEKMRNSVEGSIDNCKKAEKKMHTTLIGILAKNKPNKQSK